MGPWLWMVLAALAGPAPDGAITVPCPLQGLPQARLSFTVDGSVWLTEGDDILVTSGTPFPLPADAAQVECNGTVVRISTIQGGASLTVNRVTMDVRDVVAAEAPRRSPQVKLRRALKANDLDTAAALLEGLDPKLPENGMLWLQYAQARANGGNFAAASAAVARLDPKLPGVAAVVRVVAENALFTATAAMDAADAAGAEKALQPALAGPIEGWGANEQAKVEILNGRIRVALGDAKGGLALLEPAVARDPEQGVVWMAIGDARWALGDKKGAQAAYREGTKRVPKEMWPSTLKERCRKCGR